MNQNMNNQEIAQLLRRMASAYEIKNEAKYRFQSLAYDRAATEIEHLTSEAKDLWDEGKLRTIPGVGQSLAGYLDELFRTGRVVHFKKILKNFPEAMFIFIEIPGIGAKTAYKLSKILKIKGSRGAVEKLREAAIKGKIRLIEDFGKQSEKAILEGIEEYQRRSGRMLLSTATELAEKMIKYLKTNPFVKEAYPLGSLRRCCATVGDIDIAVATNQPLKVIKHFLACPQVKKKNSQGSRKASVLTKNSHQVDLRVQKKDSFGAILQYFTGSKMHNIHLREIAQKRNLSLSEYGIKKVKNQPCLSAGRKLKVKSKTQNSKLIKFQDEKSFYCYLGMECPPPELREDQGEIEAAQSNKTPKLVKINDIKGDLHTHSNFVHQESSHDAGLNSFEEIISKAIQLKYQYLGLGDHSPSVSQHNPSQIISLLSRRREAIDKIIKSKIFTRKSFRENSCEIRIFNTMEVDILTDGHLSVPDQGLKLLDFACASIHSSFRLDRKTMTKRVLAGLAHPKVKFLGHPTGRLLGKREGYELDWEQIFKFCLAHNKWLEINAYPKRLDLPDYLVREAIARGVKLIINTDAHETLEMELMKYGVSVARRGWAKKKDIINTLPWEKFKDIIN